MGDRASGALRHVRIEPSAWGQAWRALSRRPAFLTSAVLTLAFGIGLTTAVFSLVDTVLIKPLPYPDADRLVAVYESSPSARDKTSLVAPARLEDWQRLSRSLVAVSGSYAENVTDTSGPEPERLEGRRVTPRFFDVYATPPLVGRTFSGIEEQANGPGAVVISERLWARRFERDTGALGRALTIGGRVYRIVGVMPATFTSGAADVWLPAQLSPWLMRTRGARFVTGIARLRTGVSVDAAAQELASVQDALAREYPDTDAGWSIEIRALKEVRIGNARRGLVLVFGAVASLWAIAVVNIAGLTLVQVHRRGRELAIRAALGASRARVIGALGREGAIVALLGGALGAAVASAIVRAMPAFLSATPRINELALDWRSLAFATASSVIAACACGLIPAVQATRVELAGTIAAGSRAVSDGRHRLQKSLVVAQIALSVVLVGSATLLLRSYANLTQVETGFDPANAVTFHIGARWDEDRTRIGQMQQQLLARLEELPHVQAAGMTNFLPASSATLRYQVTVDGLTGPNSDGSMTIGARMIGGEYVRAIGAHLAAGSACQPLTPDVRAPRAALVNQRFVDVNAPGVNLVGRSLRVVQRGTVAFALTIAGVIADVSEDGIGAAPVPYVYTCDPAGSWPDPEYVVRTSDARAFAADLRRIVRELDPGRAIFGLRPLGQILDAALEEPRLDAAMLGVFASAALTLAAIGLYSLFTLVVAGRVREMAVRLAIGAAPREMAGLVMAGAGRLLAGGIGLGLVLSAAADRLLRGVLFGVSPLDASALGAAALALVLAAAVAVAGPAVRAARIAPIESLRLE
jgi:putative ABC transport system permease protein